MDTMPPSEGGGTGSIPVEGTTGGTSENIVVSTLLIFLVALKEKHAPLWRVFFFSLSLRFLYREGEAALLASGGIRLDDTALLRLVDSRIRLREETLGRFHILGGKRLGERLGRVLHSVLAAQVEDMLLRR